MPDIRAYGKNSRVIAGAETVWGTAALAAAFRSLRISNFDPGFSRELKEQIQIGNGEELASGSSYADGQDVSPSFEALIGVYDCLPIFKMAMGVPVTSGAGTLTHVFSSSTDLPPGYSLENGETNISPAVYKLITGFKVSNLAVDLSPEGVFKAKVSGKAKAYSEGASTLQASPATFSAGRYLNKNFKLKRAGVDVAHVQSFNFDYSTGLETGKLIDGTDYIGFADAGIRRCKGRVTLRFTSDSQLYNDAVGDVAAAYSLVGTTPINGAYSLTFDWARVILSPVSDPVEAAGGVMRSYGFDCEASAGGDLMKVTVINNVAAASI
jgi:hypothetical protein